jgi:hypothetical protein
MYKIWKKDETYIYCIERIADGAMIPLNPDNTDYQAYLKWLEEGNTPEPADE